MAATHFSGPVYSTNGFITNSSSVSTGETLSTTSGAVFGDVSGGIFTLTLPAVSTSSGVAFHIKKVDSSGNVLTVAAAGSDTIDGDSTAVLSTQYESITIISDGTTNWYIV